MFALTSIAGTYAVLCFCHLIHSKLLCYYGRNSIIILGTHWPIIRMVMHLFHIEHFSVWNGLILLIFLLPLELGLVSLIDRYLPFVVGRWYRSQHQKDSGPPNKQTSEK